MKALYKSAIIVTIFSVAERFLGFVYRIFLSRNLGAEGVGIYQVALSVFGVLITITASGIPITVSRLIIKNKATNNKNSVNQTISSGIFMAIAFNIRFVRKKVRICFFGHEMFTSVTNYYANACNKLYLRGN